MGIVERKAGDETACSDFCPSPVINTRCIISLSFEILFLHVLILQILLLHPPVSIAGLSHGRIPMQLYLRSHEAPADLFEGEIARFGVKVVDQREEAGMEHSRWAISRVTYRVSWLAGDIPTK